MQNTIKCENCGTIIEIDKVLTHQVEESVRNEERVKFEKEKAILGESIRRKTQGEVELKLKDNENEKKELRESNRNLQEQLLELNKLIRALKDKDEQRDLEYSKKMREEMEIKKEEITKQAIQESRIELLEKEKKIQDMEKLVEELKNKAKQGSSQLQGEVVELDLERTLIEFFPDDEIIPIEKGVAGADIKQIVKTRIGNVCGIILWESKQTKAWSEGWTVKLKEDLMNIKGDIPVLVTNILPKDIKTAIGFKNNIWICRFEECIPLAQLLRQKLIEVAKERFIAKGKDTNSIRLFEYITSNEFVQQVQSIAEIFHGMRDRIQKEKAASDKTFRTREVEVDRLFKSTANILGAMDGVTGGSMPKIKGIDLLEIEPGVEE